MLRWSVQALVAEPARLAGSVLGTASGLMLVVFFLAVYEGEAEGVVAYLEATEADVWVMQEGVSNMHMASSLLWEWKEQEVDSVPGVAGVTPILYMNALLHAGGRDWFSYVVGLDADAPRGGPWAIAAGSAAPGRGEVVIPEVVARLARLEVGDTVQILAHELAVCGISRGSFSMANSVTFVNRADLEEIMEFAGGLSYLLVVADTGTDSARLAERIEASVGDVNAMTRDDFVSQDRALALQMGTEIIRIMSGIGTIVATIIIAFTVSTQVVHHRRSYALGLAIGFSPRHLVLAAVCQALFIAVVSLTVTTVLAFTLLPVIPGVAPQLTIRVQPSHITHACSLALLASVVAAAFPASRLARIDPVTVFSS